MKRFSLSKHERITRTVEFGLAFKISAFYTGRSLKIGVSSNGLNFSRIGVSIRRQNFKLAVERNRLRRRIREAFRLNKERLSKGCDIIVIPRVTAAAISYEKLSEDFMAIAAKAGIFSKERR